MYQSYRTSSSINQAEAEKLYEQALNLFILSLMKKIIFLLLAFFALTTSANATEEDPFADIQFSIVNPYYLSFTGTFDATQNSTGLGSIDIVGSGGWHFQENIFGCSCYDAVWQPYINNGFNLEPYINAGCTDFIIYFDSMVYTYYTINKQINIHVDENKNITYTWEFGS